MSITTIRLLLELIRAIPTTIKLRRAGVSISFGDVAGMLFRRSLSADLVDALILMRQNGLDLPLPHLEAHTLAGGSPLAIVRSAARLQPTGARVDLKYLSALDFGYGAVDAIVDRFLELRRQQPDYDFIRAANEYVREHGLTYRTG